MSQINQVVIEKPVMKFLKKHPDIVQRFFDKIALIEEDLRHSLLDIKKLQGRSDRYRLRVGKYRFLFRIEGAQIIIYFYDADSRGDVY